MTKRPEILTDLECEAHAQLAEVKTFRTKRAKRTFEEYRDRATIALSVIRSYVRLRATFATEETNRLTAKKIEDAAGRR